MFPRVAHQPRRPWTGVDAWLAASTANPVAKRYVREARDDVERALAAQRGGADA